MKTNLRGKIREFVQSEEGKVGVKSPLTLGIAAGSVLLAQTILGGPHAEAAGETCQKHAECANDEFCGDWKCRPKGNGGQSCWGVCLPLDP